MQVDEWEFTMKDTPIAEGLLFVIVALIGDLDHFRKAMGMEGKCFCCRANHDTIP